MMWSGSPTTSRFSTTASCGPAPASTRSATACAGWSCGSLASRLEAAGHPGPAAGDADRERAVSHRGQSQRTDRRDLESLGAEAVDELPISLEDALIAHVGRQGDKSFFLNTIGDAP